MIKLFAFLGNAKVVANSVHSLTVLAMREQVTSLIIDSYRMQLNLDDSFDFNVDPDRADAETDQDLITELHRAHPDVDFMTVSSDRIVYMATGDVRDIVVVQARILDLIEAGVLAKEQVEGIAVVGVLPVYQFSLTPIPDPVL